MKGGAGSGASSTKRNRKGAINHFQNLAFGTEEIEIKKRRKEKQQ